MNHLERYLYSNKGRRIRKIIHSFEIYDRHFSPFVNKPVTIVEIGIDQGGSLQMWKNYFGKDAEIFGIDIDPLCKNLEEEQIHILIGSQSDPKFLSEVVKTIPPIDILIDDGGHTMKQQITAFEALFDHIKLNGIYVCEDCQSSYSYYHGGGYRRRGTFIEYTKNWIDYINAWPSHLYKLRKKTNGFTENVKAIHYYNNIIVLEKGKSEGPEVVDTGYHSFQFKLKRRTFIQKTVSSLKLIINKLLYFLKLPFYID